MCGPVVSGSDAVDPLLEGVESRERDDELRNVCGHIAPAGAVLLRCNEDKDGRGGRTDRFGFVLVA